MSRLTLSHEIRRLAVAGRGLASAGCTVAVLSQYLLKKGVACAIALVNRNCAMAIVKRRLHIHATSATR